MVFFISYQQLHMIFSQALFLATYFCSKMFSKYEYIFKKHVDVQAPEEHWPEEGKLLYHCMLRAKAIWMLLPLWLQGERKRCRLEYLYISKEGQEERIKNHNIASTFIK